MDRDLDVHWQVGTSNSASNVDTPLFCVAVVVKEGIHNPHGPWNAEDASSCDILGEVMGGGPQTGREDEGRRSMLGREIEDTFATQPNH